MYLILMTMIFSNQVPRYCGRLLSQWHFVDYLLFISFLFRCVHCWIMWITSCEYGIIGCLFSFTSKSCADVVRRLDGGLPHADRPQVRHSIAGFIFLPFARVLPHMINNSNHLRQFTQVGTLQMPGYLRDDPPISNIVFKMAPAYVCSSIGRNIIQKLPI